MLESIHHDTPEEDLRQRFDENLYVTGKQRYMTVQNGIVRRDRLVDLIHEEEKFTERVGVDPNFETTRTPIEFSEGGLVCRNGGLLENLN